jgi:nucleotide-binding universal stress UspA family protein
VLSGPEGGFTESGLPQQTRPEGGKKLMPKTIIVPLDGSAFAEYALPTALSLANRWAAELHLVTVEEPVVAIPDVHFEVGTAVRRWATDYLDDVGSRIRERTGVEAETTVRDGPVSLTIQAVVQELRADLVVMSTHGRGPMSRAWLGSIADALVRDSGVPILLVRPDGEEAPDLGTEVALRHVLIPLDGSTVAESVLELALSLGRSWDARYTLLRLVRYPTQAVSAYLPDTVQMVEQIVREGTATAEEYLSRAATRLSESGVAVETEVAVVNSVARGIIQHADELRVDLIALASHGHGGFRRAVLGSVADKVVRGAVQTVLVVRAPEG